MKLSTRRKQKSFNSAYFIDTIREILGKDPIYGEMDSKDRRHESYRFYQAPYAEYTGIYRLK